MSISPLLFSNFLPIFPISIDKYRSIHPSIHPFLSAISYRGNLPSCDYTRFICFKLLNEKNDDEDEEARAGLKKRNELLQQLLKDQDDERKVQEQHVSNRIFRIIYNIKDS